MKINSLKTIISISVLSILTLSFINYPKSNCHKYSIEGKIILHKPYCGGARPNATIAKGFDIPFKNQTFYVLKDSLKRKIIIKFTTDKNGNFNLRLRKGTYFIFYSSKMKDFDTFYQEYSKKANTKASAKSCFKKWYNSPDYVLQVQKNDKIKIILQARCFVGLNPCLTYTGPLPQ
jgi:hypothetical protein